MSDHWTCNENNPSKTTGCLREEGHKGDHRSHTGETWPQLERQESGKNSRDPWVDWDASHPYFAESASDESRPDDDPPPEIVCTGKQCGGYPHG